MNKKIFLLALAVLFLLPCMFACSKRDKLTVNKMWVSIEPKSDITISVGDGVTLTALARNAKNEVINLTSANWSVVDSDGAPIELGFFDDPKAVSVVFTATSSGSGKIVLTCEGIQSSVNITVS